MSLFSLLLDVFEDCSIMVEKQRLEPRKLNFLKNFASIDTLLDPQYERLLETSQVFHFVFKFYNSSAL